MTCLACTCSPQRLDLLCQYNKNGSPDSSMLIESWEAFVRDANLMTRTMGAQRAAALFEHAAVTNKVGQTVLRLPQFVHALVHMAYLRSNPVSALGAAHAKPTPLTKAVETLIQHLYSRFMAAPPPRPLTVGKLGGAPAAKGAMMGAMMVPGTPSSMGADSRRHDGRAASPAKRGAGAAASTTAAAAAAAAAAGGGGGRSASTLAAREAHGGLPTAPREAAALPGAAALPAPAPGASGGGASQPPSAAAGRLVPQPSTGGARSLGGASMPPVALADATNSAKVTKLSEDSLIPSACKCSPRRPLPSPQVARRLLEGLPAEQYDGVVYLISGGTKKIILRAGGAPMALEQVSLVNYY